MKTFLFKHDLTQKHRISGWELIKTILKNEGYLISCATDGYSALGELKKMEPPIDLILTDLILPGFGGEDLWRIAENIYPRIKVVFMTGYMDYILSDTMKNIQLLKKPFSISDLKKAVRSTLKSKFTLDTEKI
ncbi:MAG: response regulator [Deltaproteobacteria bacterium]|nr:response regulator [Deltaproteobacteria bacterium]